jgi:hypothetical protein
VPTLLITVAVAAVLAIVLFKPLLRWVARRSPTMTNYTRRREVEEVTIEVADWMGQTGLDEGTERELPRYLRREFGEFLDDPAGLKANDLHYLGIHGDAHGRAHFWRVPSRGGEPSFAYVDISDHGEALSLGWGDRSPPAALH